MKYHLSHLVTASLGTRTTVDVEEETSVLDEELTTDFLRGRIQFTRVNDGIYVQGRLHTQVQLTCVRCLESFSYPLDFEIAERYFFSPQEDVDESVYLVTPEGVVDIAEPVRQQLWVSFPLQALCRPNCRGLCPQCGANLNEESCACEQETIDPRLAVLKELL